MEGEQTSRILHASSVAIENSAALIIGASGQGKSTLALQLMAYGAILIGDDRVELTSENGILRASPVGALAGMIEARGVGILRAQSVSSVPVALCLDLDQTETERIPPPRYKTWLDVAVPCLHKVEHSAFPAAILQYLRGGRAEV